MSIQVITGNIFTTQCLTIVNPVNCEGVMGAGLAFECKLRYRKMFERYEYLCKQKLLTPGKLWLYLGEPKSILCFPTKNSWKLPSKLDYIQKGLLNFAQTYEQRGITSIAFPLLGADRGGLSQSAVEELMIEHLEPISQMVKIEIYRYDPKAKDDLFDNFAQQFEAHSDTELARLSGVSERRIGIVRAGITAGKIYQLNQLMQLPGIGEVTLEKIFGSLMEPSNHGASQTTLEL